MYVTVYRSGSRKGRREGKKEGLAGEGRGNERAGERERECVFHVPNHISKSECRTNEINDYEKKKCKYPQTHKFVYLTLQK